MPDRLRPAWLPRLFEPPIVDAIDHMVRRSQFEPAHIQFFRPCGFPYHVVQITAVYGKRPPYPFLPNEGPQSSGPGAASTRFAMWYYISAENTTPYYGKKAMATPADQVRDR